MCAGELCYSCVSVSFTILDIRLIEAGIHRCWLDRAMASKNKLWSYMFTITDGKVRLSSYIRNGAKPLRIPRYSFSPPSDRSRPVRSCRSSAAFCMLS